jgi:2-keto-4-pentenoate hydratase/2-oxohepta-3-ene-1,7-dioic acid hydratase in catechol pathway
MRLARIAHADGTDHAVLDGGTATLVCDPFTGPVADRDPVPLGRRLPLDRARLLAPVLPRTLLGMAHNTGPEDRARPPQAFLKAARSVIGPEDAVPLPDGLGRVDGEAELAVVLAEPLTGHTEDTVHRAVFGWTVANDVTARARQSADPLWTSAKSRTGFTPLGPWIETGPSLADMRDAAVRLSLDGRELPPASTAGLARNVTEILLHLGGYLPLGPGDVVLTGAPGAVGPLRPGGRVEATVAGVGTLGNPVVAMPAPLGAPVAGPDASGHPRTVAGGRS